MSRLLATLAIVVGALLPDASGDVVVTVLDREEPVRGIATTLDSDQITVQSADGAVDRFETGKVVEIRTQPAPVPPPAASRPFAVELRDGSLLHGVLDAGPEGETVRLRSKVLGESGGHVDLPLEDLRSIERLEEGAMPGSSRLVRIPESDAAYRRSGARVVGFVSRFLATGVEVDRGESGASLIGYDDLAAIFLDNAPLPPETGPHLVARLNDGSAVVLKKGFRVAGGRLSGLTPAGLAIAVSMEQVVALEPRGGAFVHVSDLVPAAVRRTPFFAVPEGAAADAMLEFVCPVRTDRSPDGGPILLQGERYFKGIGVRPHTELDFDLGGKYTEFRATCGIDDEVLGPGYGRGAGTGSVVFSVLVDGKKVYESPRVRGGQKPAAVRVPTTGARTLTLVVGLVPPEKMPKGAADSPELDNAVWALPLLVR